MSFDIPEILIFNDDDYRTDEYDDLETFSDLRDNENGYISLEEELVTTKDNKKRPKNKILSEFEEWVWSKYIDEV